MSFDTLWPVRPKPCDGEVLSSWLFRVAQGYGLSFSEFRKARLTKTPGYAIDIDSATNADFFEVIAGGSGVPVETVRRMGFAADEGLVYSRLAGINPEWIVPVSPNHHDSVPFCPTCLATDSVPYYRKYWRYAFAPICLEHGLLTNQCPFCGGAYGGPYLALRVSGSAGLDVCTHCLRRFLPVSISGLDVSEEEEAVAAQRTILDGLSNGWVAMFGKPSLHVCMYLRGLHDFALLLDSERYGDRISEWIFKESMLPPPIWDPGSLESQPAAVRAAVMAQTNWLVGEWPSRLKQMIDALGFPLSAIRNKKGADPNWLLDPEIVGRPVSRRSDRSVEEIAEAREVLRRKRNWAPNDAEVDRFMRTGEVPPIQPRNRPASRELKNFFNEADEKEEQREASRTAAKAKPRELYPTFNQEAFANEPLADIDDAAHFLAALRNVRRKSRKRTM